ncbi:MAG: Ig-like domain-containing protein, partial [Pseudomonadota bacterium]|nr:Ig-like domain-containing protein [Pseudomonadota bacterium]
TATDPAGNSASTSIQVTLDTMAPTVAINQPADGSTLTASPAAVTGTVTDATAVTVTVNGVPATVSNGQFSASVGLSQGANTLTATATDAAGNSASTSVSVTFQPPAGDVTAPLITIVTPAAGTFVITPRPEIQLTYSDASGVDTASLTVQANGAPLAVDCTLNASGGTCTPTADLPEGAVTLAASVADTVGNSATTSVSFTVDTQPAQISIVTPAEGLVTRQTQIEVTGTVGANVQSVTVNGVAAMVSGGGFSASVPLREGVNMLVAVGTRPSGRTGSASVQITRDTTAPTVRIASPQDGLTAVVNSVTLAGQVNDMVGGAPRVQVNGIEATVSNGSFMLMNLPLVRGPNLLRAVATDAAGNQGSHQISVTFQPPVGLRITAAGGDGQAAVVNTALPQPLTVRVTDDLGNPAAGRTVTFEVTRNNGSLRINAADAPARTVQATTDGNGQAQVLFTLGDTTGEGNNRVRASALGVAGEAQFCASGLAAAAVQILAAMGDNQRGTVGSPLAVPFEARVVDAAGNPVAGVEVTFAVVQGGGLLDNQPSRVRLSGADGIARAVLTLGPQPGINNNVVTATFPGLTGAAATFVASGLAPGDPDDTRFSGVVLDNAQTPIPGAVVSIAGTSPSATTDADGQFRLENVPVGLIVLHIDPSASPRPETFPPLEFETVTVAGQDNILGQPILLPALDTDNSRIVGGNQDVTLTMEGVEGLELTVFANSVTCPDGTHQCRVTISQVHLDKVPMPPPNGTLFMPPAWTIQPPGTHFDPPARIRIPNNGQPPGRVIEIFQFDHALNR